MGRKPNALILQFFERGPKLADNSNRYPHTCKACGESFPKGRIDSLTNHLTKKCPAISEGDRVRACLTIHGFTKVAEQAINNGDRPRGLYPSDVQAEAVLAAAAAVTVVRAGTGDVAQRDWTALETLAEVSRQIDLSEKHDDRGGIVNGTPAAQVSGDPANANHVQDRFEPQDQLLALSPAASYKSAAPVAPMHDVTTNQDHQASSPAVDAMKDDMTTEQQIHTLLQSTTGPTSHSSALGVAGAATSRLNPSLLDPQLREEIALAILPASSDVHHSEEASADTPALANPAQQQPWGGLTQMDVVPSPLSVSLPQDSLMSPSLLHKGGFRMPSPSSGKARHSRSRFDPSRRKEVQEVRKIGACIRCRILRKTCSKGHPCDACRKVLSPRIWKSGCVRTKFSEQLDLYSAGVQIVLAQHRINSLKSAVEFTNRGATLQVSIFPESHFHIILEALQSFPSGDAPGSSPAPEEPSASVGAAGRPWTKQELMMVDYEKEDVPAKVELYMRQVMHEFVEQERSRFARVTMDMAIRLGHETNDELLKKAIELWGLVEILDRERHWTIQVSNRGAGGGPGLGGLHGTLAGEDPNGGGSVPRYLKDTSDQETLTSVCLQLTAAAERKAAATSKALLTGMQRVLQDSKTKIGRNMFFTTLILLNCVEKTTWAFKAWEQDSLQPMWPLEKPPGNFTQQGYVLADLLKMLLGIRRALPRTYCNVQDGLLTTAENDPVLQEYFHSLDLNYAEVQAKQEHPSFSPTDSRSLELLFCSTLLLPTPGE